VTRERLRQMLEQYRDAWSPGARDELLAQFYAELAPPRALLEESQRCIQDWRGAHEELWSWSPEGRAHMARLDKVIRDLDMALAEKEPA
jgi:hypothetical protein